ncbi:MAG: nuclease [Gemmatimonadaceae bacterium]
MTRRRLITAGISAAALLLPTNLLAWGDAGHRMIGLAAAERLPAEMPEFFRAAGLQLGYLNPEPDRWKDRAETTLDPALNGGTSPEHYVDMDLVAPTALRSALAAPNRFAYDDTLRASGSSASATGLLPFEMLELTQKLRGDFRLWRIAPDSTVRRWVEARIIDDAGILGHYVADGSNPHHTTKHHNGWVGDNPRGFTTDKTFHSRFESQFVQGQTKLSDILAAMNAAPRVLPNVRDAVIAYLNTSFAQLDRLYEIDTATPFRAETSTPEQKAFAVARLAAGAEMLRDIWYTAWVTSGQPVPLPPRRP